ncbi:MAG: IPT/TIG domain-containing protein [Gaiellaceae bacterium]
MAADSNETSNVYASDTQYSDSTLGNIHYDLTSSGSFVDTHAFPPIDSADCPTETGTCLTDDQIVAELQSLLPAHGWSGGYGNLYVLVLPRNVDECAPDGFGGAECSYDTFCAYHSGHGFISNPDFLYAVEPYYTLGSPICDPGQDPNGSDADIAINTISHEMNEAITDPAINAWYSGNFVENGDKCAWNFGTHLGSTGSGEYNQVIGTGHYFLQREWSNALNGCYQVGVPTVSLESTSAASGATIGIAGTNFFAASPAKPTVKFNGIVSPSVTVNSPTHLTVTVPSGNIAGHVTVEAVGGIGTSTQVFGTQPAINNVIPGTAHAGETVTVNGTGFFGVTAVKFNGVSATFGSVAANGTSLHATIPAAATDGPVTVTTTAGGTSPESDVFFVLPSITSFTPGSGIAGSSLTISGSGFGTLNGVTFTADGDANGTVTSSSATQIVLQVPANAKAGPITVHTHGGTTTVTSIASFSPLPSIAGFAQPAYKPGQVATVNGANFTANGSVSVTVNGVTACSACSATATTVSFTVPNTVTGMVTVTNGDGSATSSSPLLIVPRIDSVRGTASPGSHVLLTGAAFMGTTSVAFGNNTEHATFLVGAGGTTLDVIVPANATTGKIGVTNAGGTTLSASDFVVPSTFSVKSFSPTRADYGQTVSVTGSGFTGVTAVQFNGVAGTGLAILDDSHLTVRVPASGSVTGAVTLVKGTTIAAPGTFTLLHVSGFSPSSAQPGGTVVITGTGFTGATRVRFGSMDATFTVDSDSQITAIVPAGALSGPITVTVAGASATSSTRFGVQPGP